MAGLTELAPMAAALFLGFCLLWLLWRAFRRLTGGSPAERREPALHETAVPAQPEPAPVRREPTLAPQHAAPVVPDAADILALKASIDALTKQIASLEQRLIPANSNIPTAEKSAPAAPRTPSLDVLAEVPLVVPERRR
ncbi:hypothetical protein [Microvirga rosea]|uniref:hypothetical protein n=1 Tax=Microvirga rosea TaxID=2715425 RepID=UPI001D0B1AD9|nr:hypothetical protein [Microvirga rosea]MCB8819908.1 hypothetical protein [Microvirga rosea]